MNTSAQTPKRSVPSRCSAFADLLPLLDSPGLDAEEDAAVRAHLGSCAACQAQRAAYHQMTLDARRSLSPAATARRHQTEELLASIMQEMPAAPETGVSSPPRNLVKPRRPIRPRRLMAGLAPLVVVLIIVVVAATLFASHVRPGGITANTTSTTTPSTPKASWSELHAISMVSADEGWAVGFTGPCDRNPINDTSLYKQCQTTNLDPVLMHYRHGTWTPVHVTFTGALQTISMLSATDGWAGGDHLFIHYDGHTWKPMPIPNHVTFNRLQMLSDTDGWAVGSTGQTQAILHFDGQAWTVQRLPASIESAAQQPYSYFGSLAMISPTEGWVGATLASGTPNTGTSSSTSDTAAVILHYANGQWTLQSSTPHAFLAFISMTSATDGWATGTDEAGNPQRPFLLHYTKGKWTMVRPTTNTNAAGVISMVSATEGWAVSDSESERNGPWVTYLFHYNGQQWTLVPAISIQRQSVLFEDLQMLSATEGWSVGDLVTYSDQRDSRGAQLILSWKAVVVHYHNGTWSVVPTS